MSKVILQPSGNKDAREHYEDTIQNPVPIEVLSEYLPEETLDQVKTFYPDGLLPTWGVTPGKNNVNVSKWEKIQTGDVTVFSANGQIFASGVVVMKLRHKELAAKLWGYDGSGQTWEYVYFLDEIKQHNIPYIDFNRTVGYADNYIIQGFNVLREELSERMLLSFDMKSEIYLPDVSPEEYEEEVLLFEDHDSLDTHRTGKGRKEQPFLRKQLFKNKKVGSCGICGNQYPVDLLVAAHIKKRSKCSREERLDYKNIVIPMCKFGCDDLFEKGYIIVVDGKVLRNSKKFYTPHLLEKVVQIENKECRHWNENTQVYFDWHRNQ
ncbi:MULTISPECIES: HNH endonuclease [unclassified Paenibacillus]|uniref:HNH endonuclease n=1 Tax=Paenibacillus TaxID=44249 RepID=UPI002157EC67|nr:MULTISPECIES: HNH endonuclease [unclassified Paenibacillus]